MTVREFKKSEICKVAKKVSYFDLNGVNITRKPGFILDMLEVIGSAYNADGTIDVDVCYEA